MRQVSWIDVKGFKHTSLIRDNDPTPSEERPGILQDPPNLDQIDWEGIKCEIHNEFVNRGLITWRDVQASGNGVSTVIRMVLRQKIIRLFKLDNK